MDTRVILEDGLILEAVEEVHKDLKIFNEEHIDYVDALVGSILLNDAKGELLNIVEGIGLSDKQETAIKRMVINVLHETRRNIAVCLELVKTDN